MRLNVVCTSELLNTLLCVFFLLFLFCFHSLSFLTPLYYTSSSLYPAFSTKEGFLRGKRKETGRNLRKGGLSKEEKEGWEEEWKGEKWQNRSRDLIRKVWKEAKQIKEYCELFNNKNSTFNKQQKTLESIIS